MPKFEVKKVVITTTTTEYTATLSAKDEDAAMEKAEAKQDDLKFWGDATDTDTDENTEYEVEEED